VLNIFALLFKSSQNFILCPLNFYLLATMCDRLETCSDVVKRRNCHYLTMLLMQEVCSVTPLNSYNTVLLLTECTMEVLNNKDSEHYDFIHTQNRELNAHDFIHIQQDYTILLLQ